MTDFRAQLELDSARYVALLGASLDAIVIVDHEGRCLEFNRAAEAMFGYRRSDIIGQRLSDFIVPARSRQHHERGLERYLAIGRGPIVHQRVELAALRANGEEFPAEIAIVPALTQANPIFIGFIRDMTEKKQTERWREIVVRESAHRVQNVFAVIQSVVSMTLTDGRTLGEARQILGRRIRALSRSHEALSAAPEICAPLASTIKSEIEGFSDRVSAAGPEVMMNATATQVFALILHELVTNAAKHGALSVLDGTVMIRWMVAQAVGEPRLIFQWREENGPPMRAPTRQGFGRVVLEKIAAREFNCTPDMQFAPAGLLYRLDIPLAVLTA